MMMIQNKSKVSMLEDWAFTQETFCNCGRNKALYYCDCEGCPNKAQKIFCVDCAMSDNKHNHDTKSIKDELKRLMQEWENLVEEMKTVKQIIDTNFP